MVKYSSRSIQWLRRPISGLAIIELLVAVVIFGIIAAMLTSIFNTQLGISAKFERASRQTDDSSRLQRLIETETSEASGISYSQALPSGCGTGNSSFSLTIPYGYDAATGLPQSTAAHYYSDADGIKRCGLPVNADGSLDLLGSLSSVLVTPNISMTVEAGSSSKVVIYRLYNDVSSAVFEGRAYAISGVVR